MVNPKKVCAIIPARGGSKGVLRKNIKPLAGKPLIAYSIEAALNCNSVDRVIVSTEDSEIKKISLGLGAEVVDRPRDLAADYSLTRDVVLHVLDNLNQDGELPESFVLLQPTSPLRTSSHLEDSLQLFFKKQPNCVVSVVETEHHPYKDFKIVSGKLSPLFDAFLLDQPRQVLDVIYRQNGAIYILKTSAFLAEKRFFVEPSIPFVMDRSNSIDVDCELDFLIAEMLLAQRVTCPKD